MTEIRLASLQGGAIVLESDNVAAFRQTLRGNLCLAHDGLLDTLASYAARLPTAECEIFIGQLGGATSRIAVDSTAYPHRDANFVMNVHTRWLEPAHERRSIGWARELFAKTAPHATGGFYVNFMPEDETKRVSGAYGANYRRLTALKAKYDPGNPFRLNHNFRPAAVATRQPTRDKGDLGS
ncbi:MAG TPA: BBE domain-containing protein [Roseiarcus sp.]|nr:BBE domain-containing protein [Roseiarcus sp.]